jgi:hypothetical protein
MGTAPIVLLGWDEDNHNWAASREGEPSFTGVQDFMDAWLASQTRGASLVIPDAVYAQLLADGDAPPERPAWVLRSTDDPPVC